jgi:hypothetical protein
LSGLLQLESFKAVGFSNGAKALKQLAHFSATIHFILDLRCRSWMTMILQDHFTEEWQNFFASIGARFLIPWLWMRCCSAVLQVLTENQKGRDQDFTLPGGFYSQNE